ncbi:hypothetical protein STEG23_012565 [Scotinomys teguina]
MAQNLCSFEKVHPGDRDQSSQSSCTGEKGIQFCQEQTHLTEQKVYTPASSNAQRTWSGILQEVSSSCVWSLPSTLFSVGSAYYSLLQGIYCEIPVDFYHSMQTCIEKVIYLSAKMKALDNPVKMNYKEIQTQTEKFKGIEDNSTFDYKLV